MFVCIATNFRAKSATILFKNLIILMKFECRSQNTVIFQNYRFRLLNNSRFKSNLTECKTVIGFFVCMCFLARKRC